ncbi:MAG TPA: phosphoenolpyruvate carboxykinase [Candidatus Nanoarchaeia archaeon]|nr:phosphoenolpyruvate carboxykinase [Candidatus Nanoarchaeia archaeon]
MNGIFYGNLAIMRLDKAPSHDSDKLLGSGVFHTIIQKFIDYLKKKNSPLLAVFPKEGNEADLLISLFKGLAKQPLDAVIKQNKELSTFGKDSYALSRLVEATYSFWIKHERFLIYEAKDHHEFRDKIGQTKFDNLIEGMNNAIRKVYRTIEENCSGEHIHVFRQVPAGCKVGMVVTPHSPNLKAAIYHPLANIKKINEIMIEPPLIINPPSNKRRGMFTEVPSNPLKNVDFKPEEWLCYPAQVGPKIIHLYFNIKFISVTTTVANMFDLVADDKLEQKPDAIYAYGVPAKHLNSLADPPTVFYEDKEEGILVGAVPDTPEFGFFGYIKKMMLTLHNILIMKEGSLPVHGAMVKVMLKNGVSKNIVIVGDSGAGKSESLEAFRNLADEYLQDMTIIYDDMGSMKLTSEGILSYGTETGAFVRLDDLDPGYAFGEMDRAIISSPSEVNARCAIPVTTLKEVLRGYPVDYFLYANNYEEISSSKPVLQLFKTPKEAMAIFKEGKRKAKGTTSETGLTTTYYANIFGPTQLMELHEKLALNYFQALFKEKAVVGQLRTRLGVAGMEFEGPKEAAKALFNSIMKLV